MARPEEGGRRAGAGRLARAVGGWTLLLVGGALLVLPGPGIPLVLGGLALLARDRPWARRLWERLHRRWRSVRGALSRKAGRPARSSG